MATPTEAVDLLVLCHLWISQYRGDTRPRRAAMFYRALVAAGFYTSQERRWLLSNDGCIAAVKSSCEVLEADRRPRKRELQALAAASQKPFILIVMPRGIDNRRIIGGDGYFMLLTARGEAMAHRLRRRYACRINYEAFVFGWDRALLRLGQQMANIQARDPKTRSLASVGSMGPDRPRLHAPVPPDDWDW